MTVDTACYRHPDRPTRLSCSKCGRFICPDCSTDAAVGQRCPECFKDIGTTRVHRMATLSPLGGAPVSRALIVVSVIVFLLGRVSPGLREIIGSQGAQVNLLVAEGEIWRIFTAAFLHANLMHIGFNMYALYLFGPQLERQAGSGAFAALYAAAAAGGGALAFFLGSPFDAVVGASGAIFGLFGAWLYAALRTRHSRRGRALLNNMIVILLLNAGLPFVFPNISWQGHLGGLLTGLAVAALWDRLAAGNPSRRASLAAGLAALITVIVAAF